MSNTICVAPSACTSSVKRRAPCRAEERLANRDVRSDQREHRAAGRRAAGRTRQREAQLRRQQRQIGRGQHAQPRRVERRAVDPRLHLAAFGKPRAQEREALDVRDAGRPRHELAQRFVAAGRAFLIERHVPGNSRELVFDIPLQRVARREVDRGEQRADQKRDKAERQKRPPAEDVKQPPRHGCAESGRFRQGLSRPDGHLQLDFEPATL